MPVFEAAAQHDQKRKNAIPTTHNQGTAMRGSSQEFERTAGAAEFPAAVEENPDYFRNWMGRLENNPVIDLPYG